MSAAPRSQVGWVKEPGNEDVRDEKVFVSATSCLMRDKGMLDSAGGF